MEIKGDLGTGVGRHPMFMHHGVDTRRVHVIFVRSDIGIARHYYYHHPIHGRHCPAPRPAPRPAPPPMKFRALCVCVVRYRGESHEKDCR